MFPLSRQFVFSRQRQRVSLLCGTTALEFVPASGSAAQKTVTEFAQNTAKSARKKTS